MKKFILTGVLTLMGVLISAQSGYPKLGIHIGIPTGDTSDVVSFNAGVDAAYMWNVAPSLDLGLATGYSHIFAKDFDIGFGTFEVPDFGFIPLAGTAKYTVAPNFFLGADLGYAFFVGEDADGGGFYYQPKVGYESGKTEFYFGYKGISDAGTISFINLGINFRLNK